MAQKNYDRKDPFNADVKPAILGFSRKASEPFTVQSYSIFEPLGMMVTGATSESFIEDIRIGNQSLFVSKIPASYFSLGLDYEVLNSLIKEGHLPLLPERFQFTRKHAEPGVIISVHTSGPIETVTMWGKELV